MADRTPEETAEILEKLEELSRMMREFGTDIRRSSARIESMNAVEMELEDIRSRRRRPARAIQIVFPPVPHFTATEYWTTEGPVVRKTGLYTSLFP